MAKTAERAEALSPVEALEQARREADARREDLNALEGELSAAVAEARYADAEDIKRAREPARTALVYAETHARNLAAVIEEVGRAEREREQAAAQRRAVEQAQATALAAAAREREALDQAAASLAQGLAGLDAVRAALAEALSAEYAAGLARADKVNAQVAAGDAPQGSTSRPPEDVSSTINRSRLLSAITRDRPDFL